jgi:hypothetical protein
MKSGPDSVFLPFIVVWIAIGLAGALFFWRSRDTALKRRVYPVFLIGSALVFLAFIFFGTRIGSGGLIAIPIVVLGVAMNLRQVRFCDACGRMVRGSNPLAPPKFCPGCGAPLA